MKNQDYISLIIFLAFLGLHWFFMFWLRPFWVMTTSMALKFNDKTMLCHCYHYEKLECVVYCCVVEEKLHSWVTVSSSLLCNLVCILGGGSRGSFHTHNHHWAHHTPRAWYSFRLMQQQTFSYTVFQNTAQVEDGSLKSSESGFTVQLCIEVDVAWWVKVTSSCVCVNKLSVYICVTVLLVPNYASASAFKAFFWGGQRRLAT